MPNALHEPVVTAAAAAGKHIYCEKPLARTVAEGARMADAVRRAGVKAQPTFNFRFFPAITRARQLVDDGFLGRIFSFRGRYYRSSYIDAAKPMSWRLDREASGGGAMHDLGSHVLDLIGYLLGRCESVNATLETLIDRRPVAAGSDELAAVEVDDCCFLHLRMAGGVPGLVEVSRMGTGAVNDLQVEVFGDRGAIRFRAEEPSWLEVYDATDPAEPLGGMRGFRRLETVQHHAGQKIPDWSQAAGFTRTHVECQYRLLRAIWDDTAPHPDFQDALRVQEVMAAAERSSAEGRWVTVSADAETSDAAGR